MKILILRFSSMGDILLAAPVLDVLKKEFPDSQIDWVVSKKYSEALKTNPLINRLMVFKDRAGLKKIRKDISRTNYDFIFDLHKNSKTSYLTRFSKNVFSYNKRVIERFLLVCFKKSYREIIPTTRMYFAALEKAGIKTPAKWKLKFGIDKETELETVRRFDLHNTNYIALIPGASYYTKMWPKEYFRELVRKITVSKTVKRKIFILGKGSEEEMIGEYISDENRSECVDLTGKLDLQQTAAVLKFADLVVTNDNGPMHLAECFDKKILAIFGCTTEEFGFFPYSVNYQVLQTDHLKCRPCTHFGRKKCPRKHFRCMMDISPDIVFEKICGMLNA